MLDTNKTSNWQIGVVVVMIIVAIVSGCLFLALRDTVYSCECVLTQPLVAVSGEIEYPGTIYSVTCRGTTKGTGKVCTKSVWVTMSEYERVMYGRKN